MHKYYHLTYTLLGQVVIPANLRDDATVYHLNPSGRFVIGGPQV